MLDEVAQLGLTQRRVGDLLVETELPGKIAPAWFVVQGLDQAGIGLHAAFILCEALLDEVAGLPAHRARDLVQRKRSGGATFLWLG